MYEARLRGVERHKIRIMCKVVLVDRVSTDLIWDKVGAAVICHVISHMAMSSVETSTSTYVRLWSLI